MLRALTPLVALLVFAVPAADAKAPPQGVTICGAGGTCRSVTQQEAERMGIWHLSRAVAPGKPAPFYVVRYRWNANEPERTSYWIPSTGLFRTVAPALTAWYQFGRGALEPFVAELAPYQVPRITSATVGGRRVHAPETYVRLFTTARPVHVWPAQTWLRVRLTAAWSSPWTDASADLRISRGGAYLLRDDTVFALPKQIAQRARRGLPLAKAASGAAARPLVITERDSGKRFTLERGGDARLRLSSRWVWSEPRVSSDAVSLTRVDYSQDPGFSEWEVHADRRGTATIATHATPARGFVVTIGVE